MARLAKNLYSISISGGIIKNSAYERRDYESVNEKSLSKLCPEKENLDSKGLKKMKIYKFA